MTQYGQIEATSHPPGRKRLWLRTTFLILPLSFFGILYYQYENVWTPLQRFYLSEYLRSAIRSRMSWADPKDRYRLLMLDAPNLEGPVVAPNYILVPFRTRSGEDTFVLSPSAAAQGVGRLRWDNSRRPHADVHDDLRHWVYERRSVAGLLRLPALGALTLSAVWLVIGFVWGRTRSRALKEGRRLRGAELVSAWAFNRRYKSDGISFRNEKRTLLERLLGRGRSVAVPRSMESSHFLLLGDTGTGKTTLIRQILLQIAERGETAVVYDTSGDFVGPFYDPDGRGDVILNPRDPRMPYWSPGDELLHSTEAMSLAASLFPERPDENPFFPQAARRIFARLLTYRPTPEELTTWLAHPEEIERRVEGTALASMIIPPSSNQAMGVVSSLSMVNDAFALLPRQDQAKGRWSAAQWSKERSGWVFVTCKAKDRELLAPLTSLWLDMLVLRLISDGPRDSRRVWFILDELASLQRLPQLHTAVTESRKYNVPMVLGFQARSQLETRYGHDAETMLSQPSTRIFFKTGDPDAANWISRAIGEVRVERVRESLSEGSWPEGRQSTNQGLDRQQEQLVLTADVMGMPPLHAYLKLGNLVVQLRFPFMKLEMKHEPFPERADDEWPQAIGAPPSPRAAPAPKAKTEDPIFE